MLFISSCGTNIGKTFVSGLLCAQLRAQQLIPQIFKPIISGVDASSMFESDTAYLLAANQQPIKPNTIAHLSPWRFQAPVSPHLAAAYEQQEIIWENLTSWLRQLPPDTRQTPTLIEGAGGVYVPISRTHTMLDLMHHSKASCLLVTSNYLGSISHCLSAITTLYHRQIPLAGIVISASTEPALSLQEMQDAIEVHTITHVPYIYQLPRLKYEGSLANTEVWDTLAQQAPNLTPLVHALYD